MLAAAEGIGAAAIIEARGHNEIETRVRRANEEFVTGGNTFERTGTAMRLRDMVKFDWVLTGAEGRGTGVLLLDGAGRIRRDYQFIG